MEPLMSNTACVMLE